MDDANALQAVVETLRTSLSLATAEPSDQHDELDLLPSADSIRLMRMVSILERRLDIELDDQEIRTARTVADLALLVRKELHNRDDVR